MKWVNKKCVCSTSPLGRLKLGEIKVKDERERAEEANFPQIGVMQICLSCFQETRSDLRTWAPLWSPTCAGTWNLIAGSIWAPRICMQLNGTRTTRSFSGKVIHNTHTSICFVVGNVNVANLNIQIYGKIKTSEYQQFCAFPFSPVGFQTCSAYEYY